MENKLHTALTGPSTHEDSVKNPSLRRILFDKSCLRRISFKMWPAAQDFHKKSSS
jgi:hypothetical protein